MFAIPYMIQNQQINTVTKQAIDMLKAETYQKILSISGQETKMGYKSSTQSFAGYKSHLVMMKERIIKAIEVTIGDASDGKYLKRNETLKKDKYWIYLGIRKKEFIILKIMVL